MLGNPGGLMAQEWPSDTQVQEWATTVLAEYH